jgi:hypothetical protein
MLRRFTGLTVACVVLIALRGVAWPDPGLRLYSHPDLDLAYDLGLVTEARALARTYLTIAPTLIPDAKSDRDWFEATMSIVTTADEVLSREGLYPPAGRFRNSMDLLAQVEGVLAAAESAAIPPQKVEVYWPYLGSACVTWLAVTASIKPRADQTDFVRIHARSLSAAHAPDLDAFLKYEGERPRLSETHEQQIAALIRRFLHGYATQNAAEIAATAYLNKTQVSTSMAAGGLRSLAGESKRVSKIEAGPVTAAYISENGLRGDHFTVYLPDVYLQVIDSRGVDASSEKVDRALTVIKDNQGSFRIVMLADRQPDGGLK